MIYLTELTIRKGNMDSLGMIFPYFYKDICSRGRTYVMITYVSKENDLGPDDKIGIYGVLKARFLFC